MLHTLTVAVPSLTPAKWPELVFRIFRLPMPIMAQRDNSKARRYEIAFQGSRRAGTEARQAKVRRR